MTANQAVTIGTKTGVTANGLYGSHAYMVTGYAASTGTFTLFNPWGTSHPTPLTWAQLQANCSMFVVTNTTTLSGTASSVVRVTVPTAQTATIATSTAANTTPVTARHVYAATDNVTTFESVPGVLSQGFRESLLPFKGGEGGRQAG